MKSKDRVEGKRSHQKGLETPACLPQVVGAQRFARDEELQTLGELDHLSNDGKYLIAYLGNSHYQNACLATT